MVETKFPSDFDHKLNTALEGNCTLFDRGGVINTWRCCGLVF